MSFVNLLANDVWSEIDIGRKVQAIIRSRFSQEDELKAARLDRQDVKTDADAVFIASVDSAISSALEEGRAARADMALLNKALAIEECKRILSLPEVEPILDEQGNVTNQRVIDATETVRASCQANVDSASTDVMDLVALRNRG